MPRRKQEVLDEIERRINNSTELLTEKDKEEALQRAREHVADAKKKKAVDAYFAAAVKEEERSYEPTEAMEDFYVDLPEYAAMIKINNVGYYHGCTYEVPYSQARSMADIQANAWNHEREWKDGRHRTADATRRPQHLRVSPHGVVSTTGNMRLPRM